MGHHWVQASNGLFDTRVNGIFIHPADEEGVRGAVERGVCIGLQIVLFHNPQQSSLTRHM